MSNTPSNVSAPPSESWYKDLTRYHWFVLVVCCLGWGLDCFDQQIFNIMRNPAVAQLMDRDTTDPTVAEYGGYATSIMLLGWGFGGIFFGIMGDKLGRAKTMIITIFFYAIFTGLCGLATHWWEFFIYRFLCGMGVGGQFAAGVTLLSETMPDKARPKALGVLAVVATVCNCMAACFAMLCAYLQPFGVFGTLPVWRVLFIVGFVPALLAFVIVRYLEEPKAWKDAIAAGGVKKAGSVADLFRHPRWRYNVIIGMCLATCGVIGLWGIGFFSVDLVRTSFRNTKNQEARANNGVEQLDFEFIRMLVNNPEFLPAAKEKRFTEQSFIGSIPKTNDAGVIYTMFVTKNGELDAETVLTALDSPWIDDRGRERKAQTSEEKERRSKILTQAPPRTDKAAFDELASKIAARSSTISNYVDRWGGIASLLFNLGAVFGTWAITLAAVRWGRRMAFTLFFAASFFVTIGVFLYMDSTIKVLIMQPIFGFCVLSIFGGYAIYFPELFPTRLRSTAVSFCYNIGRFAAASGPAALGILTKYVFYGTDEPFRYAGAVMAVTFIFGIIFAWLGPETKGQPLPEE